MGDLIFQFFLHASHEMVLIALLAIGYLWIDRKLFFSGIVLLCASILVNSALKVFFHVPRRPGVPKTTYSFPSGHTQSAFVLYQWFWNKFITNLFFFLFTTVMVAGICGSLLYFRYHTVWDLFGGFFVATCLAQFCYHAFQKSENLFLMTLFFLVSGSVIFLHAQHELKPSHYSLIYVLVVLTVLDKIFFRLRDSHARCVGQKYFSSAIFTFLFLFAYFVIRSFSTDLFYAVVGGALPCALKIALVLYPSEDGASQKDILS